MTELKDRLARVIQLAATMPDPHEQILTIQGIDPAGGHGGGQHDSMPFRLDLATDFWDTAPADPRGIKTLAGVTQWAGAWVYAWWRWADDGSPEPHGAPLLWLSQRLVWAQAHYPVFSSFEDELSHVERQLERACGLSPIPTGRACPSCSTPKGEGGMLERRVTDQGVSANLSCPVCGGEFTPQGLASLNRLRLDALADGQERWVPRAQARQILGIDATLLRMWISRGRLEEHAGKINLKHAASLAVYSRP